MTPETLTAVHELDSRINDGMQVRLLWRRHDNRLWVSVVDTRGAHRFRLDVRRDERPLDVFHHPFAYAAQHGVDTSGLEHDNVQNTSVPA